MIRKLEAEDLDSVMRLWLECNLEAHDFIDSRYWKENEIEVREAVLKAEVYVEQAGDEIRGFIGLDGSYICGLFVDKRYRGRWIGRRLIAYAKKKNKELTLHVYEKNPSAVRFYEKEKFKVVEIKKDETLGELEYKMQWKNSEKEVKNK